MNSPFSSKVVSKKTEELLAISKNQKLYDWRFVLAALSELKNRGELKNEQEDQLKELQKRIEKESEKRKYDSHLIPPDLPASLKISGFLLYAVFLVEILGIFVFKRSSEYSIVGLQLPGGIISLLVGGSIHLGKWWSKYILYVMFFFSTLFLIIAFRSETVFDIIEQCFILGSVIFVSNRESRNWYNEKALNKK